jgi:hypothetical protein
MAMECRLGWPRFSPGTAKLADKTYVPFKSAFFEETHVPVSAAQIIKCFNVTPPELHEECKHRFLQLLRSPFHPFWPTSHLYREALTQLFPELMAMRLAHLQATHFSWDRASVKAVTPHNYFSILAAMLNQVSFEYGTCVCVLVTRELYSMMFRFATPDVDFAPLFPRRTVFLPLFFVEDLGDVVTFREDLLSTRRIDQLVETTLRAAAHHTAKHIWPYLWMGNTSGATVERHLATLARLLPSKCPNAELRADPVSVSSRVNPAELTPSPCAFKYSPHSDLCLVYYDITLRSAPRTYFDAKAPTLPLSPEKVLVRFALWPHVEQYDRLWGIEYRGKRQIVEDDAKNVARMPRTSMNPV